MPQPFAFDHPTADGVDQNVLVNGRLIRPIAPSIKLGTFPDKMTLDPSGRFLAINENGFGTILDPDNHEQREQRLRIVDTQSMQIVQEIGMPRRSMHIGLRYDPSGKLLFVSGGYDRTVQRYRVADDGKVTLDHLWELHDCYTSDIALTSDPNQLYVSCYQQKKVARLDLTSGAQTDFDAGTEPYTMVLSRDGRRLFIANTSTVPHPPHGDTVTVLDLPSGSKAGEVHVGLGPEGLALSPDGKTLYVGCNKSDDVFEIDTTTLNPGRQFSLVGQASALKGVSPTLMALARDGKTLYVAGAGENLVAVLDVPSGAVRGTIPTEWYPTDVALSVDGKTLFILNGKGRGDGPTTFTKITNGDFASTDPVGRALFGSLIKTAIPSADQLAKLTQTVTDNNDRQSRYYDFTGGNDTALPSPDATRKSPIKHVFYILKENFSYDSAFGDLGKGEGEPSYTLWSEDVKREGTSRVTFEIEPVGDSCALTLTHDQLHADASPEIYGGWPMILSGLKTLLETGENLTTPGSLRYAPGS